MSRTVLVRQLRELNAGVAVLTQLAPAPGLSVLERLEGVLAYERWHAVQPAGTFQ